MRHIVSAIILAAFTATAQAQTHEPVEETRIHRASPAHDRQGAQNPRVSNTPIQKDVVTLGPGFFRGDLVGGVERTNTRPVYVGRRVIAPRRVRLAAPSPHG